MFNKLPAVNPGSRILAGVIGLFSLLGNAAGLAGWLQLQPLEFSLRGVLLVASSLGLGAIFLFVAISGRDPMGHLLLRTRGMDERSERS